MEFPFDVRKSLTLDHNGFAVLDATSPQVRNATPTPISYNRGPGLIGQDSTKSHLAQIIDKMGEASSKAQGLGAVITTYGKFISSGDNRLYIKAEGNQVCGILKVGKKNLFYYDGFGGVKEIRPLCVLDFYVHESMQRKGVGKVLFEKMLAKEGIEPEKLAYDRPSTKFISFLKKHYGLSSYTPQNNNFVIFNQYWDTTKKPATTQGYAESIQDYRDKKFGFNKPAQLPDPKKTETNTLGSNTRNVNAPEENKSSQPNQPYPKSTSNSRISQPYPGRDVGENLRSRATFLDKMKASGPQDSESQMKAADEAYEKKKARPDSLDLGKGKTQVWNVPNDKSYNTGNYTSKAPWGSYGANMDSFKTSSTYGSYYNQTGPSLRKK